jgi:hypothetical protein
MRYCVSGRQPYSVMRKADEIRFSFEDRDKILDLCEKMPEKTIILTWDGSTYEWKKWKMYSECFSNFYIELNNLKKASELNQSDIKWMWSYPVTAFYELDAIVRMGASYIKLGPPLCFDLKRVLSCLNSICGDKPCPRLRMTANVAQLYYLESEEFKGIDGPWVRPEDVDVYDEYIDCFDFAFTTAKEEEAYLHIYKDEKTWNGDISTIIKSLNASVDNRAIPEEFGKLRTTCGQKCKANSGCHFCSSAFSFAEMIKRSRDNRQSKTAIDKN